MKSVMQHSFSQIPQVQIPRSVFDRSHGHKTTFDAGYLIPFYVDEALPGDTFKCDTTLFARLATPIAPIMDNLFLDTFFFSVPNRLLWEHWREFNGEKDDPEDETDYIMPCITDYTTVEGDALDYMGIPPGLNLGDGTDEVRISALPMRAYELIYKEWFRDQNLIASGPSNVSDGPDSLGAALLHRRGKRHDYFTSCLPWPQKGPGVELPLGSTAPVYGNGKGIGLAALASGSSPFGMSYITSIDGGFHNLLGASSGAYNDSVGSAHTVSTSGASAGKTIGLVQTGESGVYADLGNATAATINSLREAFQLQRMYERDARGGSRYTEIIKSHFGVTFPDQPYRPEYLGGGSLRISINPVQQTSQTGTTPQGNLAAYGQVSGRTGFTKSFVEHCTIMGIVSVRADLTYQQGVPRMFSRQTRHDFYWPALAHLGEQEVLQKEIYASNSDTENNTVFGYQERFAEYRYFPSQISGLFRTSATGSLDVWHLSQDLTSLHDLNEDFIEENPPVDRIIAVPSQPHIIFDSYMQLHCARPMPVYSVPGLIDHF